MDRRLATLARVVSVSPIENADAIEQIRVRGWDVVVKKNEFTSGDWCVYFEVDSLLPTKDPRFAFLAARGERTDAAGNVGHVLRTARLRNAYSQGLVLPLSELSANELNAAGVDLERVEEHEGADLTDVLGVIKWEPALPANLAGQVRGKLPSWIPTTDEERIQNIPGILSARDVSWVATEKIDGTSTTFFVEGTEDEGVCSRNYSLTPSEGNTLWRMAERLDVFTLLRSLNLGTRISLQGETYGEGIQKNPLQVKGHHFAAFTLRVDGKEVPRTEWPAEITALSVPTHDFSFPESLDEALAQVETLKSVISPKRAAEGLVWRASTAEVSVGEKRTRASFKAISRKYLLKNDR